MENYTKYSLKSTEELTPLLDGAGSLFILACNKCFKDFSAVDEPDCDDFAEIAAGQGAKITGRLKIDFLCNKTQTARKIRDMIPQGTERVFVISCGLGVQTAAELTELPVYAAADSLRCAGHHGMALTQQRCGACAQCYLNLTGGICPIVDCSKSLVNGQCGGAKRGKCEVDANKDCAWEKICQRLEKQGRLADFLRQPIQLRDYARIDTKRVSEYVRSIREKRFEGYYGGVHPTEGKAATEHLALKRLPEPEVVVIPLLQHVGAPASPLVQVGDTVKVGQKIGQAAPGISANIHSSVSGVVTDLAPRPHPTAGSCLSIVIRSDGKNTPHESVRPTQGLPAPEEIVSIIREKGVTGMGGAGFPTAIKLTPGKRVDTILLNGCECEPMLTADHRVLLEYADDVLFGLRAMCRAVGAEKGVIAIEDNKPDAIALMEEKTAGCGEIEVVSVKTKYPQGAEKMLIKRVMAREVPRGGLPADVGVLVSNVSTAKAVSDAIQTGMPPIERVVTVTGQGIQNPGNYIVKIGTAVQELLDCCGVTGGELTLKMGGPMMGAVLPDGNMPVLKNTGGVIAMDGASPPSTACIKCGRCADVCPMELSPLYFAKYGEEGNWQGMLEQNVRDCIECGCCAYICPARLPLVNWIKAGKKAIAEMK